MAEIGVPELGQVVRCRDRIWAVNEVAPSSLPPDPISGTRPQHLVRMSSLEDDGFGDELAVIWELESGTQVIPHQELPRPDAGRLDPPERLEAFLDAVRWGAVATADARALQAPFRAGITIEDYQLDPVVRALSMPRANLLIADDVGLGKTIEAGLVVQELLLRHRARTVVVVCPAGLCVKWQEEMRDRFGLEFRIVNTDAVRQLRRDRGVGANAFTSFPRLIVSIDWLKDRRAQSLLDEVLSGVDHRRTPRTFDLLIVDEVHAAAPSGRGRYAVDSLRTRAIQRLAPHCEHRLFLSATPHNGYPESFGALLELLDPQRFQRNIRPNPEQLARVLVRRLKRELREELPLKPDGTPRFPIRRVGAMEVDYPADEREAHALLERYAALRRSRSDQGSKRSAADFVTLLLKKRLLSSPAAFANTLAQHRTTLDRHGSTRQAPASEAQLQAAWDRSGDEAVDDESGEVVAEVLTTASRGQEPLTAEEKEILDRLGGWVEGRRHRPDARADVLLEWLEAACRAPGGGWNDERVIVFTEYRDTQKWLVDLLLTNGFGGDGGERIATLYGGMDSDDRERTKAEFQAHPSRSPVRILVATDAASEGIDLQRHCWRMLHWEIPWNPSRLEQRNGRIDRHGQPHPFVEIRHFVPRGWEDDASAFATELGFLSKVAYKVEQIRDDLGSVGAVLADQLGDAMLGRRTTIDDDAVDRARSRPATRVLQVERKLREGLARCHERLQESIRDLDLTPQRLERVVATALDVANQPALVPTGAGGEFRLPPLSGSWQRTSEGMVDRLSGDELPFTFDGTRAEGRDDVVYCHLGHRLVAQSLRLLRAEVWALGPRQSLARVTARTVPPMGEVLEVGDIGVVCHARLVITGADGHRLHEELVVAGGRLRSGRFARIDTLRDLEALLRSAAGVPYGTDGMREVVQWWDRVVEPGLARALERRSEVVQESKQRELAERADAETEAIRSVLGDLRRQITADLDRLDAERNEQLNLFNEPEREQSQRDLDALRRRLDEIPEEIEREVAAVRRRFTDPESHIFPAAVTVLVAEEPV
ncbi:MAG: DISARM system SNF2-like helicase DrmD [Actinomycetota bacterium]|nr:DISARM system SNF2-like helicase DrmD [Actinomycetota bacterium]